MSDYHIGKLDVADLWHYKDFSIEFFRDVNILIGRNASGKTTILNLLRFVVEVDVESLNAIPFKELTLTLRSDSGEPDIPIKVVHSEVGFTFTIGRTKCQVNLADLRPVSRRMQKRWLADAVREVQGKLAKLVEAIWLPVSRRLPIPEQDDEYIMDHRTQLESVDASLTHLLDRLSVYRLGLDGPRSELYRDFQRQVLGTILYSKQLDSKGSIRINAPLPQEKEQLLRAFDEIGLLNDEMRMRVEEHFQRAQEVFERIGKGPTGSKPDDVFILRLFRRTNDLVQMAGNLETKISLLFSPLKRYESITNSFLEGKQVSIGPNGILTIASRDQKGTEVRIQNLSSGEKQLLILLTQALLWENKSVIYVADEPELSLHVQWQEKLLSSIRELAQQCQIIVATHSPDIVGEFQEKVIDLGAL